MEETSEEIDSVKMYTIWDYYTKSDVGCVTCNICTEKVEVDDDDGPLFDHLKEKHDVEVIEAEDAEPGVHQESSHENGSSTSNRRRTSPIWKFFRIVDQEQGLAECSFCSQVLSYQATVSNLKKHVIKRHVNDSNAKDIFKELNVNRVKINSAADLFSRFGGDEALTCHLCGEALSEGGKAAMTEHLQAKHGEIAVTDASNKISRWRQKSIVWTYFKVVNRAECIARCDLCHQRFSYMSSVSNLKRHLVVKHDINSKKDSLPDSPRRKKTSPVWEYFDVVDKAKGIARCSVCSSDLIYASTISNLNKHLRLKHGIKFKQEVASTKDKKTEGELRPIWSYFSKFSDDDDRVKCNVCYEHVSWDGELSLQEHMRTSHGDIEAIDIDSNATDAESDEEVKSKMTIKKVRSHFTVTKDNDRMAECKLCKMAVSCENVKNIVEHLKTTHKLKTIEVHNKRKISSEHDYDEIVEAEKPIKEETIFVEEYKAPKNIKKRVGKIYKNRYRNNSDSSDILAIDSDKEENNDDSLQHFGKYLISLLRELPRDVSMNLQMEFLMRVNKARANHKRIRRSERKTANNSYSSSD